MNVQQMYNYIKSLRDKYDQKRLNAQTVIDRLHALKRNGLKLDFNIDNYLYRNGIFSKRFAVLSAVTCASKYYMFPDRVNKFRIEFRHIQDSNQHWFENYGVHDSPYHDLIKLHLDSWKVDGLLNSLLCDLYVGTYNEGSNKDLMRI